MNTDTGQTNMKIQAFRSIVTPWRSGLIAVSGGVDSGVLLALCVECPGFRCHAVTILSPAHPAGEGNIARNLAERWNVPHHVLELNPLDIPEIRRNDADRCYYCKRWMYGRMREVAEREGLARVLDGSHAGDDPLDRPGFRALVERGIRMPLREAGITKPEIRQIARALDLPIWNRPASACLFTRIPRGEPLEIQRLTRVAEAERLLVRRGYRQVRVRDHGDWARIEVERDEISRLAEEPERSKIVSGLRACGYRYVALDLAGYGGSAGERQPE
ncbi:ATP-dependent sacrificial sulfur transferase LarE [bacterium]|nr:ATP-dependent sacrificial sulfur transferase LarE [candidate division CSSED10-310 bacterium]